MRDLLPPRPIISAVSAARPSLPFGSSTAPTWKKRRTAQSGLDGDGRMTVRMPATLVGGLAGAAAREVPAAAKTTDERIMSDLICRP